MDAEQSGTQRILDEHRIRILLEGRGGWRGRLLRSLLYLPGRAYGCAMAVRRSWYESGRLPSFGLPVPVISIGNLTAGGSGKTPFTILLAEELLRRGHRPGIILRGYKRMADGESDEELLYRRNVPEAIVEMDRDRVAAGRRAIAAGASVILVDDGFQHLRLRRDMDIVLVDATAPWGGGAAIPGGLLREPVAALSRAGIVVVTRSDQAAPDDVAALIHRIRSLAPQALVVTARHGPARFTPLRDSEAESSLADLKGCRVVALSGIARPEAFRQTLVQAGAEVVGHFAGPDHGDFSVELVDKAVELAKSSGARVVITEKDALKTIFRETSAGRVDSKYIWVLGIRQEVDGWEQVLAKIPAVAASCGGVESA